MESKSERKKIKPVWADSCAAHNDGAESSLEKVKAGWLACIPVGSVRDGKLCSGAWDSKHER